MPVAEAPSPTPATDSRPQNGANLNDAFSALDALVSPDTSAPAQPEPQEVEEAPEAPIQEPKPKQEVKPEPKKEAPKQEVKDAPAEPPVKAKTLREAKDMAEAKAKDWERKYKELETKASQPKEDTERKSLEERLTRLQKERDALYETVKFKAYEESDDYKKNFEKPFVDAFTAAREKVARLKVREGRIVQP